MNDIENLRVGFIGAGKVGITLGAYLLKNGLCVTGYASQSQVSAKEAARVTTSCAYTEIPDVVKSSDMVFITTQDDQINNVWDMVKRCHLDQKIICHTSGSLSSKVFDGIDVCGAYGYSIHPMYAFSDKSGNTDGLEDAYFSIEGNAEKLHVVKELFEGMGNRVQVIETKNKTLYHLANVMASNLVLALLQISDTCMYQSGAENAIEALIPLVRNNVQNVVDKGFAGALTGPIERNDTDVVARHLNALPKEYGVIYSELSLQLLKIAKKKHPQTDYKKMYAMLNVYIDQQGRGNY